MVSTRSQSVLSADAAHGDTAATAGEVNSAAPTPRRSGRLRGSATPTAAAAAAKAPPASARAARSRQPLKAIAEEQEPAADEQQAAQQQQQEQHEGAGEHETPRARRRSGAGAAAVAAPARQEQQPEAEGEAEHAAQSEEEEVAEAAPAAAKEGSKAAAAAGQAAPLKANAAVVDLLAQQMFAALDGAFGIGAGSGSSESDSEAEPQPAARAAAGRQQLEQQPAAAAEHGSGDEGSESEGDEQGHHVPAHLRWRPELTLPGMGPQQRQRGGSTQAATTAAAAAAAPSVHVVRRGGKDSLHVPPPDERVQAKAARKAAPDTAGKGWFDLPATKITDEVKSDLRMLRLRGALDPKAHYKKLDDTKFPKYFQMGTVVEGAADYYSGRLTNKQRKRTLTEEIMADEGLAQVRKKRFNKLQEERSYWAKKKAGRKTENERRKKAHHRPKH